MGEPLVHVLFNRSGAGTLKQLLAARGRDERVICLDDDLSFGPIDPPSVELRASWILSELGFDLELGTSADRFWADATSDLVTPVVWFSRTSAQEFSGLLEFTWRRGDAPFLVVDVTELESEPTLSVGELSPERILKHELIDRRASVAPDQLVAYRAQWRRLRSENAAVRVVDDTGLVSAPITHFDELIVSCVTDDWRKSSYVIGTAIIKALETSCVFDDRFLWARILTLVESGVLEGRGDLCTYRETEVRRRSQP